MNAPDPNPASVPPPLPPSPTPPAPPNGILVLDKPAGKSSAYILNGIKRLFPRGTKLGHAGTLDPFATGILLALIGKSTKRCESLMGSPKTYVATVKLNATTESLDPERPEIKVDGPVPSLADVVAALARYVPLPPLSSVDPDTSTGVEVLQLPPAYSALKIGGRPAYELARSGKPVELAPRPVRIYGISLLDYAHPQLTICVCVGRGFYVRALARDLGVALGSAGYLTQLRRTRVGPFAADIAIAPADLTPDNLFLHLQP